MLTVPQIRPALEQHRALVEQALAWLYPDPEEPVLLDAMEALSGPGESLAEILAGHLNDTGMAESFVSMLRARGIELQPVARAAFWDARTPAVGVAFAAPLEPDFDFDDLERFAPRARAFRCRIRVDGVTKGSGAFISSRLVLTAAHVIEPLTQAMAARAAGDVDDDPPTLPRISVIDANGREHAARHAWHLPVHPKEFTGGLPPRAAADTHLDVALLRVVAPLGRSFGRLELNGAVPAWQGTRRFALVHYPDGQARGFCPGLVRRNGQGDLRLPHDIDTAPGSSGGPGFDRDLKFLGLHQGRMGDANHNVGRLIPYERFAANPDFLDTVSKDDPPRYLWSLDGDLDGPIILGRRPFFTGLAAILEKPVSLLKGVWVRRRNTAETRGLGFSFEMLEAFLSQQGALHPERRKDVCHRIPTDLGTEDLISEVAARFFDTAPDARPGVAAGETSDVATDEERALRLSVRLEDHARVTGTHHWFFFENPPNGLSAGAQIQFEHLMEYFAKAESLRIVLAGFETYRLALLRFDDVEAAATARAPGLLVEPLGPFTRTDVLVTLEEIFQTLAPEMTFAPALLTDYIDKVTAGLKTLRPGEFDGGEMAEATRRIRLRVKTELGLI